MNQDSIGVDFNDMYLAYPQVQNYKLVPAIPFNRVPGANDTNYKNLTIAAYGNGSTTRLFIRTGSDGADAVWMELGTTAGGITPPNEGGTGVDNIVDHSVVIGAGTDPIETVGPGTAGETIVYVNNTSNPVVIPSAAGIGEGWSNLGMSLTAGVLGVPSEDGTAISSTNPAFVKFNSTLTPGVIKTFAITTPPAGLTASQLTSATFGATAAVAWASAMPFFEYAVMNAAETAVSFFCSRNPCAQITPATVYKGSTVASVTNQQNFFGYDNTATSADYGSRPCVRVGSFRMVKSAGDAWTIQALGTGAGGIGDGIGNYDENNYWVFPRGQNGADANAYTSNVTTEPNWGTGGYNYQLGNDGSVDTFFNAVDSVAGSGAQILRMHIPLANIEANISTPPGYFKWTEVDSPNNMVFCAAVRENTGADNYYQLNRLATGAFISGADIEAAGAGGNQNYSMDITYQAFSGNG